MDELQNSILKTLSDEFGNTKFLNPDYKQKFDLNFLIYAIVF